MRRGPAAVRSLVPHRLALTAVMLTAILAATLLSGLVSFAATVTGYAVRATLAASPATGILITSSAGSAAAAARDSRRVAAALRHALPGGPLTIDGSLGTDYLNLPAAVAGRHAQIHIISVPDPGRRAVLVAGTWPARAASGGGTALPVAVPAVTAGRLRLRPGSTFAVQVATTGKDIPVRVTGIFRRSARAAGFWALDPAGSARPRTVGGFTIYPSLIASQAGLTARGIPVSSASWVVGLDTGRLGTGSLSALAASLGPELNGLGSATGMHNVVVTTGLPALLAGLEQAVVVARSQLAVGLLILLVIAGAALALAVSLLSSQREAEAALLRARGASRQQLIRTGVAEALLLVAPAAIAGPVLGGLALPLLAGRGPLAYSASSYLGAPHAASLDPAAPHAASLDPAAPPHPLVIGVAFPAVAWLAGLAAAAACALVIMRSWLSAAQSPGRSDRGMEHLAAVSPGSGQLHHRRRPAGQPAARGTAAGRPGHHAHRGTRRHRQHPGHPVHDRPAERGHRATARTELLDALGVGYCRDRMPAQMSGGEQQRVAIGVALANEPAVLLADEPTGELDTATGEEVFAALRTANTGLGVTILVVTHDQQVSGQVRRTIAIRDGRISTEVLRHTATDEHGQEADVAQEYAVLDRAGRLQIPRDFIETLDMRDRVLLALEADHVGVWPDAAGPGGAAGPGVRRRVPGRHERDGGGPAPAEGQREA